MNTVKANKAYKYRIYPNTEQQILLSKTFGCVRKIWNDLLDESVKSYRIHKTSFNTNKAVKSIAVKKKQLPYLNEVDSIALQQAARHLGTAYSNFFRDLHKKGKHKSKFPQFKSKHNNKCSYTTINQKGSVAVLNGHIKLPKLGPVKAELHRNMPVNYTLKSATISMEHDSAYYCSLLYEYSEPVIQEVSLTEDDDLGLDYKSGNLYVDSNGICASMPQYYRKSEKQLARLQRQKSRKQSNSKRSEKARIKLAKLHRHVANQREDFLHKKSTEIANQYSIVGVEDLDMTAIARSLRLGKSTMDSGFGMFRKMLEYKLHDRGKYFIKVSKTYPSSQLCQCGYKNPITKDLKIRTVTCPICGKTYDRDVNAAINIRKESYRIYKSQHIN